MKNRYLYFIIFSILGLCIWESCSNKSEPKPVPAFNNSKPNTNSGSNFLDPLGRTPTNNVFNTTLGGFLLPTIYGDKNLPSVSGRCDCDTVTTCKYFVVSGFFAKGTEAKAAFNVYFNKKPSISRDYSILPYLPDTLNVPKYSLNDTSVYLIVTEVVKTGKTWVGKAGNLKVSVESNIPKVLFNNIKCRNISNVLDTLTVSGDIGCK